MNLEGAIPQEWLEGWFRAHPESFAKIPVREFKDWWASYEDIWKES